MFHQVAIGMMSLSRNLIILTLCITAAVQAASSDDAPPVQPPHTSPASQRSCGPGMIDLNIKDSMMFQLGESIDESSRREPQVQCGNCDHSGVPSMVNVTNRDTRWYTLPSWKCTGEFPDWKFTMGACTVKCRVVSDHSSRIPFCVKEDSCSAVILMRLSNWGSLALFVVIMVFCTLIFWLAALCAEHSENRDPKLLLQAREVTGTSDRSSRRLDALAASQNKAPPSYESCVGRIQYSATEGSWPC